MMEQGLFQLIINNFDNIKVVGLNPITDYYDVNIKYEHLKEIEKIIFNNSRSIDDNLRSTQNTWTFAKGNIADKALIDKVFTENNIDVVVNLAVQVGVRYNHQPRCLY